MWRKRRIKLKSQQRERGLPARIGCNDTHVRGCGCVESCVREVGRGGGVGEVCACVGRSSGRQSAVLSSWALLLQEHLAPGCCVAWLWCKDHCRAGAAGTAAAWCFFWMKTLGFLSQCRFLSTHWAASLPAGRQCGVLSCSVWPAWFFFLFGEGELFALLTMWKIKLPFQSNCVHSDS